MEIKTTFNIGDLVWVIHNSYIHRGVVKRVKVEHQTSYDEPLVMYIVKIAPDGSERDHVEVYEGYLFSQQIGILDCSKLWVDYITPKGNDDKSSRS